MQLSTRLFLFVAILLTVVSLAVYWIPVYVLKRSAQEDRERFLKEMERERGDDQRHFTEWIADEISGREATIDAFLFLLAGHARIQGELLREGRITESVWLRASRLLTFSERLTFLEVDQGETSAAITLSRTRLYLARQFPLDKSVSWIVTGSWRPPFTYQAYMGIWLSDPRSGDSPEMILPQIYLLFDPLEVYNKGDEYQARLERYNEWIKGPGKETPEVAHAISRTLFSRLEDARQFLIDQFGEPTPENARYLDDYLKSFDSNLPEVEKRSETPPFLEHFFSITALPSPFAGPANVGRRRARLPQAPTAREFYSRAFLSEIRRINDLELVSALSYLSSDGAIFLSPFDKDAPAGAARLMLGVGEGTAVLSDQAFSASRLFDAAAFFDRYPPTASRYPIASQFGLVDRDLAGALTLVNVLQVTGKTPTEPSAFLTLGTSLNQVLERLAEISGQQCFLLHDDRVVAEVALPGQEASRSLERSLEQRASSLEDRGFITLDGTEYYYSRYVPDPDWNILFVTLEPAEVLLAPIQAFEKRSQELTRMVSHRIIAVAIGVFVIALLVLEMLARHFTRPITVLAHATNKVAEGKYDEVVLPEVSKKSKNEITILTHAFSAMVKGLHDREKLRSVLNKVVSKEIADEILKGRVHLGGEVRGVTVLFADIRGFSKITEDLPPDEIIVFINSYMTVMTEIIEAHRGVIDKYVGDEVMALFGAPVEHKYSTLQAILSALVMREKLIEWNRERAAHGLVAAEIGIGINTGPMVAGNMGAEDRLNYTVMGPEVNLAARLCQEAQGMEILIAEQMLSQPQVAEAIAVEEKAVRTFKGFSKPIRVYRVLGLKEEGLMGELSQFVRQFGPEIREEEP